MLAQKAHMINKKILCELNYCLFLPRTKKNYFAKINISSKTDNKKFWETVKPLFSDKISHKETVNLVENDTVLSDDQVVADTFNNYCNNIVKNLLTLTNKTFFLYEKKVLT